MKLKVLSLTLISAALVTSGYARTALAKLYGVHSIPRPILLDRETRVYTPSARGKKLDQALAELFKDDKN